MRRTNQAGINLIKKWEGWRARAYRDSVGVWTIGYGHTSMAGPPTVTQGMTISKAEGERILARDLGKYEKGVIDAIGDAKVTDDQFAAMVSLCYNIGPGAFKRSSLARHVRNGDMDAAARAFALYRKAGGKVLQGLVNRRADEAKLFRGGIGREVGGAAGVGVGGAIAIQQGVSAWVVMVIVVLAAAVAGLVIWRKKRKR